MSLISEINKTLHDEQTAQKLGDMADAIVMQMITHIRTCIKSNRCPLSMIQHCDISAQTGMPFSFLSIQPADASGKTAQYIERDGRKHIVLYDNMMMELLNAISGTTALEDEEVFEHHRKEVALQEFSTGFIGKYDDMVHELVHMTDGVDWEAEKANIRAQTDPYRVRFGADPAEQSVDELKNVIAQTRRDLYNRSAHESRANFISGLNKLLGAIERGNYTLPDNADEFIWDFADQFCPEYDQTLDEQLRNIYGRLVDKK